MATNLPRIARRLSILLLLGVCGIAGTLMAQGTLPRILSYQGVLSDAKRTAVPDSAYSVTFRIYDAETGGAALWKETDNVETVDGIFESILGTSTPIDLPFDKPYWIAIELQGEPEMTPRVRFVAAPYAMRSMESENSLRLDPGAPGVVHSINALDGDLVLIGEGMAGIRMSGDTLAVVVPRLLPQGAKDGQVIRWNAAASQWEAADPAVVVTPRLSGNGSASSPLDIARMGAANGQPLIWDDAQGAWRPGSAGISVDPPLRGDGSAAAPLGLRDGDSDRQVLMWDAAGRGWKPAAQRVVSVAEIAGNGTSGDPLHLAAQGALNGEVLRWDSVGRAWHPGSPVSISTPPLSGTGTPADPLRVTDGVVAGQLLMWTGTRWNVTAARQPQHGELLRWNAASGLWEPAGLAVTNTAPLSPGAIWYGNASSLAAELGIGRPNQLLVVAPGGTGPAWSSNLTVDTINALAANVQNNVTVGGDLTVVGGTSLKGSLTTEGVATFSGDLVANDSAAFNGPVRFARFPEIGLQRNAMIVGDGTDHAAVYSSTNSRGAVLQQDASGAPVWLRKIDVDSVTTLGLRASGDVAIGGNLTTDGNATFNKDLVANDSAAFNGPVRFSSFPEIGLQKNAMIVGDAANRTAVYPSTNSRGAVLQQDASGTPVWLRKIDVDSVTTLGLRASGDVAIGGNLAVNGTTVDLPAGSVDNAELAHSSIAMAYGSGVAGDASVSLGGTLNVRNTGVTSITGTARQVIADRSTGDVTLSLPQDIHTDATPTFDGVILDNLSGGSLSDTLLVSNGGRVQSRTASSLIPLFAPILATQVWTIAGNAGTTPGTNYLGTSDNQPFQIHVDQSHTTGTDGRGRVMRFEPNATSANIIGGYQGNSVAAGVTAGTISGGGRNGAVNTIASGSNTATISGGSGNAIQGSAANSTIAGGSGNTVQTSASSSTISGGSSNTVQTSASTSVIAGGSGNTIQGSAANSVISGGNGNTILTSASTSTIAGGGNNSISSTTSVISGGDQASIGTNARWSMIGGGHNNKIFDDSYESSIGAGEGNQINTGSARGTVGGGSFNVISTNASNATISGGYGNNIRANADRTTIGGGMSNTISPSAAIATLAGGFQNTVDTNATASTVSGGQNNRNASGTSVIGGGDGNYITSGSSRSVIGGGFRNLIATSSGTATIAGGENDTIQNGSSQGTIGGGGSNYIGSSSSQGTIAGGTSNRIGNSAQGGVISGGNTNIIGDNARYTAIAGGRGLTLSGRGSFGFLGGNDAGSRNMTVPDNDVAVFGNADVWLASNDNTPSLLKFFSSYNAAGTYPNGTHYVAMQAPSGLAADIAYILPDAAGIVGDILQVKSVSGSTLTLDWGAAGGSSDWSLTGNTGTTPGTNYIGTNDDQAFEVHVGNSVSTGTDGRGRVMRFEPNATSANIIGGYRTNSITTSVVGGTISGGGMQGGGNSIGSNYGTVGGGNRNVIGATSINATISGGVSNSVTASAGNATISGGLGNVITSGDHTTIGGGFNNKINTGAFGGMIGGGTNNQIFSHTTTISGGNGHTVGLSAQFSTIAGGNGHSIGSSSFESVIIGGSIDTIEATSPYSSITGGTSNAIRITAARSTIGGGYDNEIGLGSDRGTIGGGEQNRINAGAYRSTISGGVQNVVDVNGRWGTIGGGEQNYINGLSSSIFGGTHDTIESSAQNGFIGGGDLNAIRSSARFAVVSGGRTNQVMANSDYGVVSGGQNNQVQAAQGVVSGGQNNIVSGARSAIAGGYGLTLSGFGGFGFLGGNTGANNMTVSANNTAVFGNTDLWLANNDNVSRQIRFYEANTATGAFPNGANYTSFQAQAQATDVEYLLPAAAGVMGDQLTISGVAGTQVTLGWAAPSDRRIKTDFLTLTGESILQKFRGVDLGTWRYIADPSGRRHYGIMAQDFKKLFGNDGRGEISTDTTVNNIDMMGVSYLAIQGLEKRTSEDRARIDEMGSAIRELKEELESLRRENQALRQQVR